MNWKKSFAFNKYKLILLILWLLFLFYKSTQCMRLGGGQPTLSQCLAMSWGNYQFYLLLIAGVVVFYTLTSLVELGVNFLRKTK